MVKKVPCGVSVRRRIVAPQATKQIHRARFNARHRTVGGAAGNNGCRTCYPIQPPGHTPAFSRDAEVRKLSRSPPGTCSRAISLAGLSPGTSPRPPNRERMPTWSYVGRFVPIVRGSNGPRADHASGPGALGPRPVQCPLDRRSVLRGHPQDWPTAYTLPGFGLGRAFK